MKMGEKTCREVKCNNSGCPFFKLRGKQCLHFKLDNTLFEGLEIIKYEIKEFQYENILEELNKEL